MSRTLQVFQGGQGPLLNRIAVMFFFIVVTFVTVTAQQSDQSQSDANKSKAPSTDVSLSLPATEHDQKATQTSPATYVFPTSRQRFNRYVRNTVGPVSLARSAASAGLSQWDNDPLEWGQGAEGYGKRFASNFGKNAIRHTVQYGLSEAFRLDTGFQRSKRKGFWPRLSDALVQNVTSRTRSGKRVLSAPIFVGVYTSSIISSETWYPSRYSYKDGLRSGTYSLATGFALNALREFVINF